MSVSPSLFISTPISSYKSEEDFSRLRAWLYTLAKKIATSIPQCPVFCAACEITSPTHTDDPVESVKRDLQILDASTHFVLVFPEKLASSALIELGYALAKKKPVLIIAPSSSALPFMALGLGNSDYNVSVKTTDPLSDKAIESIVNFVTFKSESNKHHNK